MSRWLRWCVLLTVASCQQQACPSGPGKDCDPRRANCPAGYHCALAEICTRRCEQTSDCWLKVETGCRITCIVGERLADGGTCREDGDVEFCPESLELECAGGYCQRAACLDGGCDYDLYGPSGNKGNRSQGP